MGSSGGRSASRYPALTLKQLQGLAGRNTDQAAYDTQVGSLLHDVLSSYNDRDVEVIGRHLQTIEDALSKELEDSVRLMFGGSVARHTYVNGLSDVDTLVCLNNTSLSHESPSDVMTYFEQRLRARLPQTDVHRGDLAVTVTFSDGHEIQLLPAVRTASGYRIASSGGEGWSDVIAPARFAAKLTAVNQTQGGKVVPTAKLYKALNDSLPRQSRLAGYHIESLAIDVFQGYEGPRTLKHMLRHFCAQAKQRVLTPIADSTGQSRHVDDYLGMPNSIDRRRASQAIANLENKIARADTLMSLDIWKEMLS